MQLFFCIINLWNAVERRSREEFSQESYLLSSRIWWHREEQSPANSLALITVIRTIGFSILLSQKRKNEVLLHESTMVLSAFTGKRVGEQMHSLMRAGIHCFTRYEWKVVGIKIVDAKNVSYIIEVNEKDRVSIKSVSSWTILRSNIFLLHPIRLNVFTFRSWCFNYKFTTILRLDIIKERMRSRGIMIVFNGEHRWPGEISRRHDRNFRLDSSARVTPYYG